MKVGIISTGWIAQKAAETLNGMSDCRAFAVASRSKQKAEAFARQWEIPRFYGSYKELIEDPEVDLVYIGTPHSHHYDVTKQAIEAGKPCLVEKAFMANFKEASEIIELARNRKVFLAEAIWTRYQPAVNIIRNVIANGEVGQPKLITSTLAYDLRDKERLFNPDLCGGALLDLGVYLINFVRMFGNANISSIDGVCVKGPQGVDISDAITVILDNGILANLQCSSVCVGDNISVIAGTEGNLIVDNTNNPRRVTISGRDRVFKREIQLPPQITGYEYQFEVCRQCLRQGLLEPTQMPWREILYVMKLMDDLRFKWGIHYPMD